MLVHQAYRYELQPTRGQLTSFWKHAGMARFAYNWGLQERIRIFSWFEFRRLLNYKAIWYGSELVIADRFFPSSKTCSACGTKKDSLTLSDRVFKCESCSIEIDRDLNAARNLANLTTGSSPGSNACRDGSSDVQPSGRETTVCETGISLQHKSAS